VLFKSADELKTIMGKKTLSEYVKICHITLMFELFLNKEEYTLWELNMAELFSKNILKIL